MNKTKVKYVVDMVTLVSFVVTALSGLAIKFFMPGGVRQGRLQEFLGMQKGVWSEMHDIAGIVMIIAVILHIIFYWRMFVCMTKNFFKKGGNCEVVEAEVEKVEE